MAIVTLSRGSTSVTLTGSIGYNTDFYPVPLNFATVISPSGIPHSYFGGKNKIIGLLEVRGVSIAEKQSLFTFIMSTLMYVNSFSISALPNTDLGVGVNTIISSAYLPEDIASSMEKIKVFNPPGMYNISLPYWFILQ